MTCPDENPMLVTNVDDRCRMIYGGSVFASAREGTARWVAKSALKPPPVGLVVNPAEAAVVVKVVQPSAVVRVQAGREGRGKAAPFLAVPLPRRDLEDFHAVPAEEVRLDEVVPCRVGPEARRLAPRPPGVGGQPVERAAR
jgi:hypothetical protein